MSKCLYCNQSVYFSISLPNLLWVRHQEPLFCKKCENLPDLSSIAYEKFIIQRDYRWYVYFAMYYAKKLKKLRNTPIFSYPPLSSSGQKLPDYTLKILQKNGINACTLAEQHIVSESALLVDFNGVLESDSVTLNCQRLSLWGEHNGEF